MTADVAVERTPVLAPATAAKDGAAARKQKRARKRLLTRLMTISVGVALAAGAVFAAWPKPLNVQESAVRLGALEVTVDESGRARVRDRYTVTAPLGGDLMRPELKAGDLVTRGAAVARILPLAPGLLDPRSRVEASARVGAAEAATAQSQAQVARAETALRHATEDLELTRRLVESGSMPRERLRHDELELTLREQELAAARFGSKVAINEVELARAAVRHYSEAGNPHDPFLITAPVSGRVLRVLRESAGVVAPGAAMLEVGDPNSLEVVVEVLTADAVRIAPGAAVTLERWGGDRSLMGHVRLVEPSAFTKLSALGVEEQRVNVIVDIDDPRQVWERLGDGFRVEARIATWRGDGVVLVPASAVFRRGEEWAAFVDTGAGARLRTVKLGQRGTTDVQVLSGLAVGERVIVHPSTDVVDGARVRESR